MQLPFLTSIQNYSDLLIDLFNAIGQTQSYKLGKKTKDTLYLSSDELKTIVLFVLTKDHEDALATIQSLKTKFITSVNGLSKTKAPDFEKLILLSNFADYELLQTSIQKTPELNRTPVEYWGWDTISTQLKNHKDLLPKYYPDSYVSQPENLKEVSAIDIDGNDNITLQGIANSFIVVNKTDTAILQKIIKANADNLDHFKTLINDLNVAEIKNLLQGLMTQLEPKQYLAERQAYRQRLSAYFEKTIMDEKDVRLSDIYIEPDFLIYKSSLNKEDPRNQQINKSGFVTSEYSAKSIHTYVAECLSKNNTLDLKEIPNVLLVLGYPGQGKTSFCKKTLHDLLIHQQIDKDLYFFRLREIDQIKRLIDDPLELLRIEAEKAAQMKIEALDFGKSLLILDGLDEIYMRENLSLNEIDRFCDTIINEAKKNPDLQVIITSRLHYVDLERLANRKALILQLKELDETQQLVWVALYREKKGYPNDWFHQEITSYQTEPRFTHLRELICQPLLLYLVAQIKTDLDQGTNRAKIYSILFDEVIERRYDERPLDVYEGVSKDDLRKLIQEIAFAIFASGKEYINKTDLQNLPESNSFLLKFPGGYQNSIKLVLSSFYFQEVKKEGNQENDKSRSAYVIEFLHKSLEEYMVAEKMYMNIRDEFLASKGKSGFAIDDYQKALTEVFKLFSKNVLTIDIQKLLIEIIQNEDPKEKGILNERLALFFPEMLEHNFLPSYNVDNFSMSPYQLIKNTFVGYWTLLFSTNSTQNYLTNESIRKTFTLMLRLVLADEFKNKENSKEKELFELPLTHQNLEEEFRAFSFSKVKNTDRVLIHGTVFDTLETYGHFNFRYIQALDERISIGTNYKGKPGIFYNFNLGSNVFAEGSFFENCIANHARFEVYISTVLNLVANYCQFEKTHEVHFLRSQFNYPEFSGVYSDVYFSNCDFQYAEFLLCKFINVRFINCNFDYCQFKRISASNLEFYNCNFEYTTLENDKFNHFSIVQCNFKEGHFKKCKFENSIFVKNQWENFSFEENSTKSNTFLEDDHNELNTQEEASE